MYGYGEFRTKDGRLGLAGSQIRVRSPYGRFYNKIYVIWIDEERREIGRDSFPLGQFNKTLKPVSTGHRRVYDAGTKTFV